MAEIKAISSISDIIRAADKAVQVVEIPGWAQGDTIRVKLRRTTLRIMLKTGKIPNSLMAAAQRMIEGGAPKGQSIPMEKTLELMDAIVEDAMVEPTYQEIKDNGLMLTDDQVNAIVAYAQSGVNALTAFRGESGDAGNGGNG